MLKSLHISGFRCFRELKVEPLTRVNLFVGTNNSGKTSILEAAEILAVGLPSALLRSCLRRREYHLDAEYGSAMGIEQVDPSHLFYGRTLRLGQAFELDDKTSERYVRCDIEEAVDDDGTRSSNRDLDAESAPPLGFEEPLLRLDFSSHLGTSILRLSTVYGLSSRRLKGSLIQESSASAVKFLGTEQPDSSQLSQLWDSIALTPTEIEVTETLKLIEPGIDRIAFLGEGLRTRNFFLRLAGSDQRIPLGSVGDGLKRLLSLALHLQSAKGGVLLVDEIDTGLHYTVLAKMWRLVIATAKRLDLQVLATTHSLDCLYALATVYQSEPELAAEVTVHRVEKEQPKTVSYQPEEIAIAAEQRIEVR